MQVKYIGVFEAVLVPELGPNAVRNGDVIEVDDDLGARLLAQRANWQRVSASGKGKE